MLRDSLLMAQYLLIESRDTFESNDARAFQALAAGLARAENQVTLFLVQNGVLAAREGVQGAWLTDLVKSGVEVLADEFSLRERGIPDKRLTRGIKPAPLEVVIDQLADGRKALWH